MIQNLITTVDFGPALLLVVVMQRRHAEYALAGEPVRGHLDDHRDRLKHEQAADDGEHQLMLGGDGNSAEGTAKGERSGIAHEDLGRRRVEPQEAEAGTDQGAADDGELAGALDKVDLEVFRE